MKCPLLVMARLEAGGPMDTPLIYCLKEECAWWIPRMGCCAVVSLAMETKLLSETMTNVLAKMPHEGQFRDR